MADNAPREDGGGGGGAAGKGGGGMGDILSMALLQTGVNSMPPAQIAVDHSSILNAAANTLDSSLLSTDINILTAGLLSTLARENALRNERNKSSATGTNSQPTAVTATSNRELVPTETPLTAHPAPLPHIPTLPPSTTNESLITGALPDTLSLVNRPPSESEMKTAELLKAELQNTAINDDIDLDELLGGGDGINVDTSVDDMSFLTGAVGSHTAPSDPFLHPTVSTTPGLGTNTAADPFSSLLGMSSAHYLGHMDPLSTTGVSLAGSSAGQSTSAVSNSPVLTKAQSEAAADTQCVTTAPSTSSLSSSSMKTTTSAPSLPLPAPSVSSSLTSTKSPVAPSSTTSTGLTKITSTTTTPTTPSLPTSSKKPALPTTKLDLAAILREVTRMTPGSVSTSSLTSTVSVTVVPHSAVQTAMGGVGGGTRTQRFLSLPGCVSLVAKALQKAGALKHVKPVSEQHNPQPEQEDESDDEDEDWAAITTYANYRPSKLKIGHSHPDPIVESRPMFTGRGQKPSNKDVLAAIAAIKKCQQGSFLTPSVSKPCSCGWHTRAAARKRARQAQSDASASSASPTPIFSATTSSTAASASSSPSPSVPPATISATSSSTAVSAGSSPSPSVHPSTTSSTAASAASPSPSPPITNIPTASSSRDLPMVGTGPVPPKFDRSDFQSPTISELRATGIGVRTFPGKLDMIVYCPLKGRCPHCNSALITANSVGKRKLCYAIPWPKTIVGVDMRCGKCNKHFMTHDPSYVDTLPSDQQIKREFVSSKGNGSHISLLRLLRSGLTVAQVERYIEDEVRQHYLMLKSEYIELWDKVDAMRGVGKVNVAPRDAFPPFPSHYFPCRPHITAMFVKDYQENKPHIMRELRCILSQHTLAVDHQRKVVKRTLGDDVVGHGGQTFTICGDFGLICGVYVVPDTALSWAKKAMSEVIDRHESVGVEVPKSLYMDCGCCGGKVGSTRGDTGTSVAALWRSTFSVKLDAMHLMLRIGREMNAEHPRRKKFLIDLSHAIFVQHEGDRQRLINARETAGLEGPPTRTERVKFIR